MKRKLLALVALLLLATAGTMAQTSHTLTVKEGTADADRWTIVPNSATAGQKVIVTYSGKKKVKSVRARKKGWVTSITLGETTQLIAVGRSVWLHVTEVAPDDALDKTYTWSSDNTDVATVNQNGMVRGVSIGTAHIRATANDGSGVYAECECTVVAEKAFVLGGQAITRSLEYTYKYEGKNHSVWAYWDGISFTDCDCDNGHHYNYGDDGANISVNGTKITLGVSSNWENEGLLVEFDTSNNTYRVTRINNGKLPDDIISVTVNGVEIKDKLTKL